MKKYSVVIGFLYLFIFQVNSAFAILPEGYQSLLASEKLAILWENVVSTRWKSLPELRMGGKGVFQTLRALGTLGESFKHASDEMPSGRPKLLHPLGSIATVEWIPEPGTRYTGIYQSGGIGLVRLSLAGDPRLIGYTPGIGLKFLIDGNPSVNLHAMNNLNGQGADQNFFAHPFSTSIPDPRGIQFKLAKLFFSLFVGNPLRLSVDHLARRDSSGALVERIVSPERLIFKPNPEIQIDPQTPVDFREELAKIPVGSTLYTVEATAYPGALPVKIGRIVTTSEIVASRYGDRTLFFQHHE